MKRTQMLTKKLISFWMVSLAAVTFIILLGSIFSFIHTLYRFQQHQVVQLTALLTAENQQITSQDTKNNLETWLPPMLTALHAKTFVLVKDHKAVFSYKKATENDQPMVLYHQQLSNAPNTYFTLAIPRPFAITLPDKEEMIILLLAMLALIIFVRLGYRWIRQQLLGIEALAFRSQLILSEQYEQALTLPDNGQPRLINRALIKLVQDLIEAEKERGQFDQFIRANTFLDPQTRIGNKLFFDNRLEALSFQQKMKTSGVMYFLAIEDFEILQKLSVSQAIIGSINKALNSQLQSIFARMSENTFAIVVPQIALKEAEKFSEHLLRICVQLLTKKIHKNDNFFHIGAAYFNEGDLSYQLVDETDKALKAAQLQGNNNWFMYDKGIIDKEFAQGSVRWRSFLENALNHNQLVFFGESYKDVDGNLHHIEISTRIIRHSQHQNELIRDTLFMPMADRCGLTPQVHRQIVENVLSSLIYKNPYTGFSVNLTRNTLESKDFLHWLKPFLLEHEQSLHRIFFELPEETVVCSDRGLQSALDMLKTMGARLSISHVGQKISESNYIKSYQVDLIKLHRSVTQQINLRPENQILVRSLIGRLHRTGKQVFADVESVEEWQTLKILGVTGGKGSLFGTAYRM